MYVYICAHVCVINVRMYVCICAYAYVCMYICVYVCIYMYMHTHVGVHEHLCRRISFTCTVQSLYYMRVYLRCFFNNCMRVWWGFESGLFPQLVHG